MNKQQLNSFTDGNGNINRAEQRADAKTYVPAAESSYYTKMGALANETMKLEIKQIRTQGIGDSNRRGKSIEPDWRLKLGTLETCGW